MRGEVVVEEELAAHDVEGDVVGGPEEEEEACAVVEAGAGSCVTLAGELLWSQVAVGFDLRLSNASTPRLSES